ncbi:MAG: NifB/NifX family molybdenum-iron cluster-binding protein [Desulfobacterales bacterium]|jgi:predicted Fe-Mo cluster-binding NifX family protein
MKTAFAVWNNRIAPVFDVTRRVIIVESEAVPESPPTTVLLAGDQPLQKVRQLSELGADRLVCGAISRALQAALTAGGIRVIPFIAGDVQEVIDAWRGRQFEVDAFAMPGRRRKSHRLTGSGQPKEDRMGNKRSGGGRRPGGRGQGGKGRCRQDPQQPDQSAAAGTGACVCTQCGHSERHERGTPCIQKKCPQCGAIMSRQ